MPVTKTAKRALRVSHKKTIINRETAKRLDIAVRSAKKKKTEASVKEATSLADRAAKKGIIHKNKAAHLKSQLSKLISSKKTTPKKKPSSSKRSKREVRK